MKQTYTRIIIGVLACFTTLLSVSASAQNGGRGLGAIIDFNASYQSMPHQVLLQWHTLNEPEYQVQYFIVEHSVNGNNIHQAGSVLAVGEPSAMQSYTFVCDSLTEGVSYYRITVVNLNGEASSTDWKAVNVENPDIHLYPTLLSVNDYIKVSGLEVEGQLHIYGSKGRINGEFSLQPGCNTIHMVNEQGLYYYYILKGDQVIKSGKFEILNR